MSADIERLAELFKGEQFKSVRATLMAQAAQARALGAPEHFSNPTTPLATVKETTPVEVKGFSNEVKEALEKQGYVIDTLTGQSIASLRKAGRKFWSTWHNDYPQFEALTSIQSEVAINPSQLFIPKSNNKTLKEQEDLIARFSQKLGKKVPGVLAIMGSAPDYIDLAFAHLDTKGEYLFGENDDYNYARTNTPTVGARVAGVGSFRPVRALYVYYWYYGSGYGGVFAAPLVVPKI